MLTLISNDKQRPQLTFFPLLTLHFNTSGTSGNSKQLKFIRHDKLSNNFEAFFLYLNLQVISFLKHLPENA